jgi:hypothetical protein
LHPIPFSTLTESNIPFTYPGAGLPVGSTPQNVHFDPIAAEKKTHSLSGTALAKDGVCEPPDKSPKPGVRMRRKHVIESQDVVERGDQ